MSTPTTATPGARALYLGSGTHKRVHHTQEALVVTNSAGQTQRFPLVRVIRVVSSPNVDWAGGALALCLRHGISITWADNQGHPIGSACPSQPRRHSAAALLELMLEHPHGPHLYANWQRSRRMSVLSDWRHQNPTKVTPQQWEATKQEWVYNQRLTTHLPHGLHTLCQAWVVGQCVAHQVPTLLWDAQGNDVPLAQHLTELLWAHMNLSTGSLADTTQSERERTALFEHWLSTNGASLMLHIGSLLRLAKSQLQPQGQPI